MGGVVKRFLKRVEIGIARAISKEPCRSGAACDRLERFSLSNLVLRVGSNALEAAAAPRESPYWRSYLFLEAQHLSVEVDDIELGGRTYMLGFRMEFNLEK